MKRLDLLSFPLDGLALVEASAGTGKTYTLANLYLRYLLEKQFKIDQILVVTFTEAATQELRDRIRQRIQALREVFEGASSDDAVLLALFEQSPDQAADLIRLRIAERQMDQCEIYTIHGFCQRLLQNHSMVLGSPLQQSLSEDLSALQQQCAEDYWREQVLHLPATALQYVRGRWQQPSGLLAQVQVLFQRNPQRILPPISTNGQGPSLLSWCEKFEQHQAWFERLWQETLATIDDVIALVAGSGLKNAKRKVDWLNKIRDWCEQGDSFDFPVDSKKNNLLLAFTPDRLLAECKKNASAPTHAWFDSLDTTLSHIPTELDEHFELCGYEQIKGRMEAAKQQQSLMGFDDLIEQVALGLSSQRSPEQVEALVTRVRQQYELALIDEFQDTDPAQYQIFSTLFTDTVVPVPSRMVLIGDPKQAIYAFRGGDMATYLRAKRDIHAHPDGNVFTMATNWRSSPSMVEAVNAVFTVQASPFFSEEIPFMPVAAAKQERTLKGPAKSALQLAYVPADGLSKDQIEQRLMTFFVDEIAQVLARNEVQSSDIAILVRTGRDAQMIKAGLAQVGIRASFEGRESIFQTEEAIALYWLLQVVAEPGNVFLQRQCLAQSVMAFSDEMLVSVFQNPNEHALLADQFEALHQSWMSQGILAMVRRALEEFEVLDRWRIKGDAFFSADCERRLSNLNQLAEILQQQSRTIPGHQAIIRWLRERIQKPEAVNDQSRVRLESDDQLVQIVTIHKSKGLEYPLVFLPFMFSGRPAQEAVFYDEEGKLTVDLLNQEANLLRAERERLEEDMRLLYVALTRAKYRCYLGFSNFAGRSGQTLGLHNTAWGRLLRPDPLGALDDSEIEHAIQSLQASAPGLCEFHTLDETLDLSITRTSFAQSITDTEAETAIQQTGCEKAGSVISARELSRTLLDRWKVQSFTGIINESHKHPSQRSHSSGAHSLERAFANLSTVNDNFRASISIFDFPKGSRAGTFLHTLFEGIALESGELIESLRYAYRDVPEYIQSVLSSAGLVEDETLDDWAAYLYEWIKMVIASDLHEGLKLCDVAAGDYLPELDFHFPAKMFDASRLNSILADQRPDLLPLIFESFEGHVKGAIDLVFKHGEKFYILDYKSNYLGDSATDYQTDSLQIAIDEHRYDLQYLLYTLAVHRHLSERLGDRYDYQRDFGGVIYLFLRGVEGSPESAPEDIGSKNGVYFCRPGVSLIRRLDQMFRGETDHSGQMQFNAEAGLLERGSVDERNVVDLTSDKTSVKSGDKKSDKRIDT